jgi:hypothetical protein
MQALLELAWVGRSTSPAKVRLNSHLPWRHIVEARVSPRLEFALELEVSIGPVFQLGWGSFGLRRTVPITGGTFRGPGISGRVLPGGADWQFVDRDGLTLVDSHYVIETVDAVRIEVSNPGIRHGAQDVLDRIAAGEPVSPSQYYFRTAPRFHPPDGKYEWLKKSIFLGDAERHPELVILKVWRVA